MPGYLYKYVNVKIMAEKRKSFAKVFYLPFIRQIKLMRFEVCCVCLKRGSIKGKQNYLFMS